MKAADAANGPQSGQPILLRIAVYVLIAVVAVMMVTPLLWLVRSSLLGDADILRPVEAVGDILPGGLRSLRPQNYSEAVSSQPFLRYLYNTLLITGGTVVGGVLSSSIVAYAFAFCRTRWNQPLFLGVLATMMLPPVVTMVPTFVLFRHLGWIDSFKPLVIPQFCGAAFAIFLFRQFFLTLPRELIEAAKIDGATSLQIYWQIILPLAKPAVIAVAIFSFIGAWNDFMGPLIYLNSKENWTLQLGLQSFMGEVSNQWNLLMAATVMVLLPVLVVFFCLQRYFVSGIALTGMKG